MKIEGWGTTPIGKGPPTRSTPSGGKSTEENNTTAISDAITARDGASSYVLHLARAEGGALDTKLGPWDLTFAGLVAQLQHPLVGAKDGPYFVRGKLRRGCSKRKDENIVGASLLILDGDSTLDPDTGEVSDGAPDPEDVHEVLTQLGIAHIIYSSFSHGGKGNRYRVLIPAEIPNKEILTASVDWAIAQLHEEGVYLANARENNSWSQPWYLPRLREEGAPYVLLSYLDGDLFDVKQCKRLVNSLPKQVGKPVVAGDGLIDKFNAAHDKDWMRDKLRDEGYRIKWYRAIAPGSTTGTSGVSLFENDQGKWVVFSHHGDHDILAIGKYLDAFDLFRIFDYDGDVDAAVAVLSEASVDIYRQAEDLHLNGKSLDEALASIDNQYFTDDEVNRIVESVFKDGPSVDIYHGMLGDLAQGAEGLLEASSLNVYVHLLAHFGASLGRSVWVEVNGLPMHPNLHAVVVGDTALARKSSGATIALELMGDSQQVALPLKDGLSSAEGVISLAQGVRRTEFDEVAAGRDYLKTNEKTTKKGMKEFVDQRRSEWEALTPLDQRIFVSESEIERIETVGGRKGNPLTSVMRQVFDGDSISVKLKNSCLTARNYSISTVFQSTPGYFSKVSTQERDDLGSLNRLLVFRLPRVPRIIMGKLRDEFSRKQAAYYQAGKQKILDYFNALMRTEGPITYTDEAYEAYEEFRKLELPRADVKVLKIAMIHAVQDRVPTINLEHMWKAINLVKLGTYTPTDERGMTKEMKLLKALAEGPKNRTYLANTVLGKTIGAKVAIDNLIEKGLAVQQHTVGKTYLVSITEKGEDYFN